MSDDALAIAVFALAVEVLIVGAMIAKALREVADAIRGLR
jgi:hypothetical protein